MEAGQVAHSEDARVGHLHFLDDELGTLHGEPALQLGVQGRRRDALLHDDPLGAVRLGLVDDVEVRVVQVQFDFEVVAAGRVPEVLVLCDGRKVLAVSRVSAVTPLASRPVRPSLLP